ncbi:class I adenylate-forming enzyme family protein [Rhodococcus wratislaviensis]|uniref:class I adenylate-forming enzyme family protein n=1 Tax=Rhodococcus wratislaviensis TaxID=44752 RepID=UPI0036508C26
MGARSASVAPHPSPVRGPRARQRRIRRRHHHHDRSGDQLMKPSPPGDGKKSPELLPQIVADRAASHPDSPAIVHGETQLTYSELNTQIRRAAAVFENEDIKHGDRLVVVGHNSIGWIVAYLAGLRVGAVVSPANNRLNTGQFVEQCALLDAQIVLHDADHAELAAHTGRRTIALEDLEDLRGPESDTAIRSNPDDDAVVSFTSGTTGTPKGAVLSHRAVVAASQAIATRISVHAGDSTLVLVPLFHNTGFIDQLGVMLVTGGSTHLMKKYRTSDALAELVARPVSYLTAVPSILRMVMVSEDAETIFHEAQVVLFGGSPMPNAWSEELLTRWPHLRLVHGYGLTEFTSGCTTLPPDLIGVKGESVGFPLPGVDLQILGDDGRAATAGDTGEILVRGVTRMSRYWKQPELTAAKTSGDWLRTGDLGYLDEDGLLWLTGRVDDVINRGGEKVLPAHVESKIAKLAPVSEATVFPIPDLVLQQRVAAAVTIRSGRSFNVDQALTQLRTELPDYAIPEQWVIYEELPRTASGKSDRRAIAREYQEGKARHA